MYYIRLTCFNIQINILTHSAFFEIKFSKFLQFPCCLKCSDWDLVYKSPSSWSALIGQLIQCDVSGQTLQTFVRNITPLSIITISAFKASKAIDLFHISRFFSSGSRHSLVNLEHNEWRSFTILFAQIVKEKLKYSVIKTFKKSRKTNNGNQIREQCQIYCHKQ